MAAFLAHAAFFAHSLSVSGNEASARVMKPLGLHFCQFIRRLQGKMRPSGDLLVGRGQQARYS